MRVRMKAAVSPHMCAHMKAVFAHMWIVETHCVLSAGRLALYFPAAKEQSSQDKNFHSLLQLHLLEKVVAPSMVAGQSDGTLFISFTCILTAYQTILLPIATMFVCAAGFVLGALFSAALKGNSCGY